MDQQGFDISEQLVAESAISGQTQHPRKYLNAPDAQIVADAIKNTVSDRQTPLYRAAPKTRSLLHLNPEGRNHGPYARAVASAVSGI
ncbi:MAG: hypothetical protein ACYCOR_21730, partial [Acidobacteriaceae bacterium]